MSSRLFPLALLSLAGLTAPASAAEPPRRAPPPLVALPFSWTGPYVGVNVGSAGAEDRSIRTIGNNGTGAGAVIAPGNTSTVNEVLSGRRPGTVETQSDSFNVGGGLGYNFQLTPGGGLVVGAEVDAQYLDLNRTHSFTNAIGAVSDFRQGIDMLSTVRGRVGYAFNNVLVYGTGGFGFGLVNYQTQFLSNAAGRPLAYSGGYDGFASGFAYGGGVEFALPAGNFMGLLGSNAITIRGEYIRYDLGSRAVIVNSINPATGGTFTAATGSFTSRYTTEGTLIRASLNYKFGL